MGKADSALDAPLTLENLRAAIRAPNPEDVLPFVCVRPNGEGRDFWAPRPTGDYSFDCELGGLWGRALLPLLREDATGQLLRHIVLGMCTRGEGGRPGADRGLIVGLVGVIGQALAQRTAPALAFTRLEPAAGRTSL
jgi:hypothetical protein